MRYSSQPARGIVPEEITYGKNQRTVLVSGNFLRRRFYVQRLRVSTVR